MEMKPMIKKSRTTSKSEKLFHQIVSLVPGAVEGTLFGALCIKAPNGKSAAILWKEDMVFKLEEKKVVSALTLDGARSFEPMRGKPMREWVQLSFKHSTRWKEFTIKSIEYVLKQQPVIGNQLSVIGKR